MYKISKKIYKLISFTLFYFGSCSVKRMKRDTSSLQILLINQLLLINSNCDADKCFIINYY